ncbi:MAG: PTS transporter subunit EIIC [Coriobacteriia bacterium]|nr:PTS transporter subunit EIIC [Coriobacteriia bacterium]
MNNRELAECLFDLCGGKDNIELAENCMTRLRVILKDTKKVDYDAIKKTEDVLGLVGEGKDIQIVIGPGKVKKVTDNFNDLLKDSDDENKLSGVQGGLKKLSQIFVPLIPGIMAAGLMLGVASIINVLISQNIVPTNDPLEAVVALLTVIGNGCLSFLCIFVGINAAKVFKCSQILGGLIGGIVLLAGVADFAKEFSDLFNTFPDFQKMIYNPDVPSDSLIMTGKGGVIGVLIGVWILSKIENWLHKHIPDNLDIIIVPFVSALAAGALTIIIIMPLAGLLSGGIIAGLDFLGNSDIIVVKALYGFVLGATFLPMVMLGLHQSLVPIYILQLDTVGYISMIAPQMMAGGANIGAAIAVYFKAKSVGHKSMQSVIKGSLPTAILGIHEPLIYGMTLPIPFLFVPIGIGAGVGGIYCVFTNVLAASYGPATLLGVTTMQPTSMLNYLIGLVISCVAAVIFTQFMCSKKRIQLHKEGLE